jgi:hypothetical protein
MKLELTVPSSLSEIPLCNYQKYIEVCKSSNDPEFLGQKMIEIFCGIELKKVINISLLDVIDLTNHFSKLFSEIPKFSNRFKIKDIEFGFIENLEKIKLGEHIDIDSNIGDIKNLHIALAAMYRPIIKKEGDKYEIIKYDAEGEYIEAMKYCPLSIALPAQVFFWNLGNELIKATLNYLENQTKKTTKKVFKMNFQKKDNLLNNGDGILQSINSLKEILEDLTRLQTSNYLPHLHF